MKEVFKVVYDILKWMSKITGFTYNEINIIVYFILLPFVFIYLIDRIFKINYLKIGFGIVIFLFLIFIPDFKSFSDALFDKSVDFLNGFDIVGMNYIQASVAICVIVPIIILYFLIRWNKKERIKA